eukprot:jgi/Galph1/5478/GphlegSOOS_G4129.1
MLANSSHGKARVRVAKVFREPSGIHRFVEVSVKVSLQGGTDSSFLSGDNSKVVATDSCKNIIYVVAKQHSFSSIESFAMDLIVFFLDKYSFINAVTAVIEKVSWKHVTLSDRKHKHGFIKRSDEKIYTEVTGSRVMKQISHNQSDSHRDTYCFSVVSGIYDLSILKTTQSGWEGFYRDEYTTLPETQERLLATCCKIIWKYIPTLYSQLENVQFTAVSAHVKKLVFSNFFGSPSEGVHSPGVQYTLYQIGENVLKNISMISEVSLSMPNLHFLPAQLEVFKKNGFRFANDVYIPTDEPHGIIEAKLVRPAAKL